MNVITNKLNTSLPSLLGKARVWGFFLFLLFSLPLSAKTWTAFGKRNRKNVNKWSVGTLCRRKPRGKKKFLVEAKKP